MNIDGEYPRYWLGEPYAGRGTTHILGNLRIIAVGSGGPQGQTLLSARMTGVGSSGPSLPWYSYPPVHDFGQTFSWASYPVQGEDIPMPQGTPITAVVGGTVSLQYYDTAGGTLFIQADDPSQLRGIPYFYYFHLDNIVTQLGQHVNAGDLVGYSGGQNVGGSHPSAPNYSSGPHLEFGLSKTNSIPYMLSQITPDLNPDWLLGYAQQTGLNAGVGVLSFSSQTGQTCQCPSGYSAKNIGTLTQPYWACVPASGDVTKAIHCTNDSQVNDPFGLAPIAQFINSIAPLTEWLKSPIRIVKMAVGLLLVGSAIFLIATPEGQAAQGLSSIFTR